MSYFRHTIHLITGPMFSGKTEELQRLIRRHEAAKKTVLVFTPKLDTRSGETVRSHAGRERAALPIRDEQDLKQVLSLGVPTVLAFDEFQFFSPSMAEAVHKCRGMSEILIAGLHRDWQGRVFPSMQATFEIADTMQMLTAICSCGEEASYTYRRSDNQERIQVGGAESYEALCWQCWARQRSRAATGTSRPDSSTAP